jgi:hypothetical protein
VRIGKDLPKSFFYCLRDLRRREAFFIRVWGDYDFHSGEPGQAAHVTLHAKESLQKWISREARARLRPF